MMIMTSHTVSVIGQQMMVHPSRPGEVCFGHHRWVDSGPGHNNLISGAWNIEVLLCIILVHNMTRLTAEKALVSCFHHTIMILICGGGENVVNAMVFSDQSLNGALFNLLSKMQVSKFTRISK